MDKEHVRRADSIVYDGKTQKEYFVQPHTEKMPLSKFLRRLSESRRPALLVIGTDHRRCTEDPDNPEIYYLQSQNGNIYRNDEGVEDEVEPAELAVLQKRFQTEVAFMTEALGVFVESGVQEVYTDSGLSQAGDQTR